MKMKISIDTKFMNTLIKDSNNYESYGVLRDALVVYRWYLDERKKRRVLLSANEDGSDVHRLEF